MSSLASSFIKTPTALVFDSRLIGDHVRCYTVIRYFHWKRTTITASLLASTLHTTERSIYRWLHQLARCGWVTFTPQRGIPWDKSTIIVHDEVLTPESEPATSSDTRVTTPPQDKTPVSKLKTPVSKLQGNPPHQEAVLDAPLDHKIDLIQIDLGSPTGNTVVHATHRTKQEGTMKQPSEMQGRLWEDTEPPHPAEVEDSSYPKRSPQPPPVPPPPPSPRTPSLITLIFRTIEDGITACGYLPAHRKPKENRAPLLELHAIRSITVKEVQQAVEQDSRRRDGTVWRELGSHISFSRIILLLKATRVQQVVDVAAHDPQNSESTIILADLPGQEKSRWLWHYREATTPTAKQQIIHQMLREIRARTAVAAD